MWLKGTPVVFYAWRLSAGEMPGNSNCRSKIPDIPTQKRLSIPFLPKKKHTTWSQILYPEPFGTENITTPPPCEGFGLLFWLQSPIPLLKLQLVYHLCPYGYVHGYQPDLPENILKKTSKANKNKDPKTNLKNPWTPMKEQVSNMALRMDCCI